MVTRLVLNDVFHQFLVSRHNQNIQIYLWLVLVSYHYSILLIFFVVETGKKTKQFVREFFFFSCSHESFRNQQQVVNRCKNSLAVLSSPPLTVLDNSNQTSDHLKSVDVAKLRKLNKQKNQCVSTCLRYWLVSCTLYSHVCARISRKEVSHGNFYEEIYICWRETSL